MKHYSGKNLFAVLVSIYWLGSNLKLDTYCGIAQLPADHTSITSAPTIITDCSPHSSRAHLHSACPGCGPTPQTNCSINKTTSSCYCEKGVELVHTSSLRIAMVTKFIVVLIELIAAYCFTDGTLANCFQVYMQLCQ